MANKSTELTQIGIRLSNCRQNRNMTQEELARRLGITPQAVSKWERSLSLPDISMLADLARLLDVSTDWLLGLRTEQTAEPEPASPAAPAGPDMHRLHLEMGDGLRNCLSPLELAFGEEIIPLFTGNAAFLEQIRQLKRQLANEGIWTPVIRIRDLLSLGKREFMILSFHRILYAETLPAIDDGTCEYMMGKLKETIQSKYCEILYPDLMKHMIDNLKIAYPALLEDIVPEKIPYGLLTETAKIVLSKGIPICYLPKIVEIMESALRRNPTADARELAGQVTAEVRREDNYFLHLQHGQAQNQE